VDKLQLRTLVVPWMDAAGQAIAGTSVLEESPSSAGQDAG